MLLEFNISNFLSFKDQQVLRLYSELNNREERRKTQIVNGKTVNRLALIFGPNGSGKSNLVTAFKFTRDLIVQGYSNEKHLPYLDKNNEEEKEYSYFEYTFNISEKEYSYGFELDLSSKKDICFKSEWLYVTQDSIRNAIIEKEYDKAVDFLSLYKEHNSGERKEAFDWFLHSLVIKNSTTDFFQIPVQEDYLDLLREKLIRYDTGIKNITETEYRNQEIPFNLIKTHSKRLSKYGPADNSVQTEYDVDQLLYVNGKANGKKNNDYLCHYSCLNKKWYDVRFQHEKKNDASVGQQSDGTIKIMHIILLLLKTPNYVNNDLTLILDELECSIHTRITSEIINNFLDETTNKQLIATTHESRLLSDSASPRDVWLMARKTDGVNDNTMIMTMRSIEPSASKTLKKDYLSGKYGAIPIFTDLPIWGNDHAN